MAFGCLGRRYSFGSDSSERASEQGWIGMVERDDELLDFIREDMRQRREAEETRAEESRERTDRLWSVLERLVPKGEMAYEFFNVFVALL